MQDKSKKTVDNKQKTMLFSVKEQSKEVMRQQLQSVYDSLVEKGYNPINQLVGYIVSEDPTYITNYNNSRAIISKIDRDELLRNLVEDFIVTDKKKG
ncbi:MAG: IreB family regulatory phosphoprotein [Clostridia bacterium]|nr:IreB family regulatory phosphoprotein [Clostridia bacterium]MBR5278400.1 IreB family regulatory phosphoprotein [Clostridia bacterium]